MRTNPLLTPPWQLVRSRWLPLALCYLATGVMVASLLLAVIFLPLLGIVLKLLEIIESVRAALFLDIATNQPVSWRNTKERFSSAFKGTDWRRTLLWQEITWKAVLNALACALFPLATFTLIVIWPTVFVTAYRLLAGHGIVITGTKRILLNLGAAGQFLTVIALCVVVIGLLYLTIGLAWLQAQFALQISPEFDRLKRQVKLLATKESSLVKTFEAERLRMERQLHDGPQQNLAAAAIHLGLAQVAVSRDSQTSQKHLALAQQQIQAASDELRNALGSLRPRTLVEDGLAASIEELLAGSPLETVWRNNYDLRVPFAVESTLNFITREFVANTYKYSSARTLTINLESNANGVKLYLSDDGVGDADATQGTGILGIINRLQLLGADFSFISPSGGPTELNVEISADLLQDETQ